MFKDNPVLGVGIGNYAWNVERYELIKYKNTDLDTVRLHGGRAAHSLYFTLIPEMGSVGTIIFLIILIEMFRKIRYVLGQNNQLRSDINNKINIELNLYSKAFLTSLISFLVCGTFISVLYYPHFWYLIGLICAMKNISEKSNHLK